MQPLLLFSTPAYKHPGFYGLLFRAVTFGRCEGKWNGGELWRWGWWSLCWRRGGGGVGFDSAAGGVVAVVVMLLVVVLVMVVLVVVIVVGNGASLV